MTSDLQQARDSVDAFARLIGQPLTDWQAAALRLERRTTVIVAPRQSGKSRSLSVLALWWAYRRTGQRVLVVSAGEEAARRLLASASSLAVRSPVLRASVVDENSGLLTLSNGSEVRSVPASERQVRGWSVDLLLVDEAALVDDELLLGAAIPTTAARPSARVVLAGSPGSSDGAFYRFAQAGIGGADDVGMFVWALTDASWISTDVVEGARRQLAPAQFAREYLGEFADVDADERVIAREWVEAAVAFSAVGEELMVDAAAGVVFGLDVARHGGDESVLVSVRSAGRRHRADEDGVLEDRRVLVARVEFAVREPDLMRLAARVASVTGHAPVWVDVAGMGWGVRDRLQQLGASVAEFNAAVSASDPRRDANQRAQAWWHARELFQAAVVDLDPDDGLLADQLAAVRYGLTEKGARLVQSKETMRSSPDRADALVIALWAARQSLGMGEIGRVLERARLARPHPLLAGAEGMRPASPKLWRKDGQALPGGLVVVDEPVERPDWSESDDPDSWMGRLW